MCLMFGALIAIPLKALSQLLRVGAKIQRQYWTHSWKEIGLPKKQRLKRAQSEKEKGKKSKQEIAYEKQGLKLVNGLLVPVVKESPEIRKMKALIATLPHSVGPKCKVESFVNKWLLPAINAQSAKEAHDMRFALRHILAKIALDETEADLDEVVI